MDIKKKKSSHYRERKENMNKMQVLKKENGTNQSEDKIEKWSKLISILHVKAAM